MVESNEIPQPWESEGVTKAEYMRDAIEREVAGATLARMCLVNGYATDDAFTWDADEVIVTEWRTGHHLVAWDLECEEPDFDWENTVIVERTLSEVA